MDNKKKNNRFDALKGEKQNIFKNKDNKFKSSGKPPQQENSRWKRDDEQEQGNRFKTRRPYGRGGGRGGRRGYGRNRRNMKSEKFHGKSKDMFGAPIIEGCTQRGFNIGNVIMKEKPKRERKKKKEKKKVEPIVDKIEKKEETKTQEQLEKEREWHRQFLIECQMVTDSEDEEEDENSDNDDPHDE